MKFQFLSWLLVASRLVFSFEAIDKKPLLTAKEVLSWVSPQASKPLMEVESLLEKLPEAYRTYFVLQYNSQSNHSSDETHPRVIFFGPDAKLLLAFSGLPSDPHYHTVEMIEYEPDRASFSFYSLHFQPTGPARVEVNPKDCQRCHGEDPKPNWEPYSLWPGTFGSLHDRILIGSREHAGFESFLKSYQQSTRYRNLPAPFHVEAQANQEKKDYYLWTAGVGPGSSLSILLGFLNRDRIVKKLMASPSHPFYRPALTAAMLNCQEPIEHFVPEHLRKHHSLSFSETLVETKRLMNKDLARKLRVLVNDLQVSKSFVLPHADLFGLRETEVERIAKLRYLIQKGPSGLNFDRWALSISKTSLDFNDGIGGLENLIGHYLEKAYAASDLIHQSISLRSVPFSFTSFDPKGHAHHSPELDSHAYTINTFSILEGSKSACSLLLKEAQALSSGQ